MLESLTSPSTTASMPTAAQTLLQRAQYIPLIAVALYGLILALSTVPAIQRELVFLHRIRFPFSARYDNPTFYGIAPYKGRNIHIETLDGEVLGAWHILPHSIYIKQQPFPPQSPLETDVFDTAFTQRPTVLYLHGNAATRAAPHRIRTYMQLSSDLDCNVVAVDYRGFGDSTGTPSQPGLITDARAAWDWISAKIEVSGRRADKEIILLGHSLGTGVASALAGQLADEGLQPRAVGLIAPFTSIPDLLSSFWLFGIVPILTPLKAFPGAQEYFKNRLEFRFNSTEALSRTSAPMLILHAVDDSIIPPSHSAAIFKSLTEPNGTQFAGKVEEIRYEGWGTVRKTTRGKSPIVWWEGEYGNHVNIGHSEGTIDLLAFVADL